MRASPMRTPNEWTDLVSSAPAYSLGRAGEGGVARILSVMFSRGYGGVSLNATPQP